MKPLPHPINYLLECFFLIIALISQLKKHIRKTTFVDKQENNTMDHNYWPGPISSLNFKKWLIFKGDV